ncbi:unnamed protein product [Macrosiphum euphorbiae]|uniref:Secreted protein n=1 Tax=Macrosiphum euphorbiae TaxID=13131 RepID=A0AAV0XAD5_9HEMI|nr:unnamed protein product [Macrosiphum euphorbiae]
MLLLSATLIAVRVSLYDGDVIVRATATLVPRAAIELSRSSPSLLLLLLLLLLCNGIGSPDTAAGVVRETVRVRNNITVRRKTRTKINHNLCIDDNNK